MVGYARYTNNNFHHFHHVRCCSLVRFRHIYAKRSRFIYYCINDGEKSTYRRDSEYYFSVKKIKGRKVSTMKAKLCSNLSEVDCSDVGCKIIKQVDVGVILWVRVGGGAKKFSSPFRDVVLTTNELVNRLADGKWKSYF